MRPYLKSVCQLSLVIMFGMVLGYVICDDLWRAAAAEMVQQFVEKLVAHPHVTHVSRLLGRYDYFVQIAAEDVVAFDTVLDDIKAMQPGAIADIEIANIIDGLKTDDFSGLLS